MWHFPIFSIMLVLGPFLACRVLKTFLLLIFALLGNVVVHVSHAIVEGWDQALIRICFVRLPKVVEQEA